MAPKNFFIVISTLCSSLLLVAGLTIIFGITVSDNCTQRYCLAISDFIQFYESIFFIYGLVLTLVSSYGFLAIMFENKHLLDLYAKLLLFVLLILFLILWLGLWGKAPIYLHTILTESFKLYDKGNCRLVSAIDNLQRTFHCCGVDKPSDWQVLRTLKSQGNDSFKAPLSCCANNFFYDSKYEMHCLSTYTIGCLRPLRNHFWKFFSVVSVIALGISLNLIAVSVCILKWIKDIEKSSPTLNDTQNLERHNANNNIPQPSFNLQLKGVHETKKAPSSTAV